MEASEQGGAPQRATELSEEQRAAAEQGQQARAGELPEEQQAGVPGGAESPAIEQTAVPGASAEHEVRPVATGETDEDAEEPDPEHAPVATEAQDAIIGDPGLRGEQQPLQSEGTPTNVNQPVRTSAPPPSAQSGVPLPEDRAAGIEPGVQGPAVPVDEGAEGELPEHDASEGQSTTPPLGG